MGGGAGARTEAGSALVRGFRVRPGGIEGHRRDPSREGRDDVRGLLRKGGTILGTSRIDPYIHGEGLPSISGTLDSARIDSLVVIGGDGSLRTAARLSEDGLQVVGIPKTIDNDIAGTDVSIGFHTAVQIVVDAIDRLTTTAESHNRVMVVEVMGRTAGWIAAAAGLGGGAEAILVPEVAVDYQDLADRIVARHNHGHHYSLVVVAEGVPGDRLLELRHRDDVARFGLGDGLLLLPFEDEELPDTTGIEQGSASSWTGSRRTSRQTPTGSASSTAPTSTSTRTRG